MDNTTLASTDKINIVAFSLKVLPLFRCLLNPDLFRGSLLGFGVNFIMLMFEDFENLDKKLEHP